LSYVCSALYVEKMYWKSLIVSDFSRCFVVTFASILLLSIFLFEG